MYGCSLFIRSVVASPGRTLSIEITNILISQTPLFRIFGALVCTSDNSKDRDVGIICRSVGHLWVIARPLPLSHLPPIPSQTHTSTVRPTSILSRGHNESLLSSSQQQYYNLYASWAKNRVWVCMYMYT